MLFALLIFIKAFRNDPWDEISVIFLQQHTVGGSGSKAVVYFYNHGKQTSQYMHGVHMLVWGRKTTTKSPMFWCLNTIYTVLRCFLSMTQGSWQMLTFRSSCCLSLLGNLWVLFYTAGCELWIERCLHMSIPVQIYETIMFTPVQIPKDTHVYTSSDSVWSNSHRFADIYVLQMEMEKFYEEFIRLVKYFLIVFKREPAVERAIDFVSKFSTSLQTAANEDDKGTEKSGSSGAEQEMHPFILKLFNFLLQVFVFVGLKESLTFGSAGIVLYQCISLSTCTT